MHHTETPPSSTRLAALTIGAIGVVFGDIGTSPLYAFREALAQSAESGITPDEILGVLSLALWALMLVVTVKYVLFLLRADNNGEGGVLSLMALAKQARPGPAPVVFALGAAGAALFYGDAVITPALSVLSAVEGLKTVPGMGAMDTRLILGLAAAILIGLFAIQSHGTARVARLFGPVCVVWFLAIGGLGLAHIADRPAVLLALNPVYGVMFVAEHGMIGLFVLGAVFLTVTGAEALTADMGHFGRAPIRIGWFALVFPALALNYLGQGAFALAAEAAATKSGQPFVNADWFFLMAPDGLRAPLVILATMATIIASQAVITGAFSLSQQAIALGMLPRLIIKQTSQDHSGQIYMPTINWILLAAVLILVYGFGSSSSMAAAYGIAVTGTMVITTCLAFIVVRRLWQWRLATALALIAPLLALDVIFFGANILRVTEGGWVPLLIAALLGVLIVTWVQGRALIGARVQNDAVALDALLPALTARPPRSVEGVAVFLASDTSAAPAALLHNLKHNKVLHDHNIILNVATATRPHTDAADRLQLQRLDDRFTRATLTYGYMETPDVPTDLLRDGQVAVDGGGVSFFISRNSVGAAPKGGMPFWQDIIFIFLQRNASDPTQFFRIPPNRVVELGTRIEV